MRYISASDLFDLNDLEHASHVTLRSGIIFTPSMNSFNLLVPNLQRFTADTLRSLTSENDVPKTVACIYAVSKQSTVEQICRTDEF